MPRELAPHDRQGDAREGPLVGGNLAVSAALVGTPYRAVGSRAACVFLEDVGERPYRVDRMLTSLRHAGWFDRVVGVVLGAFTEGHRVRWSRRSTSVLRERLPGSASRWSAGFPRATWHDNLELARSARA